MANFYTDNEDLQFYIKNWIDWASLYENTELNQEDPEGFTNWQEALESYEDILHMIGQFSAEEIAPYMEELSLQKPKLVDGEVVPPERLGFIFEQMKELGLHGVCLPREFGGMNCPLLVYMLIVELLARSDVAVMSHYGFHGGIAMAMLVYSLNEGTTKFDKESKKLISTRFEKEIMDIVSGEAWGSMDITEPHAGSDVGALRTYAEQDEQGNWFVTGSKIWITSGHGQYHIVLARTDRDQSNTEAQQVRNAPMQGLKGLSLFLVSAFKENENGEQERCIQIDRVDDKLGQNASTTVGVSFDRSPAQLIGEVGGGFKQMLLLMNNARISVGFESIGLCEAALRMAKDFAAERKSMGKTIDKHELIADIIDEMESDLQGMRALAMDAAFNEEMAQRQNMRLNLLTEEGTPEHEALKKEVKKLQMRSRLVTPLIKFLSAEKAVEFSRKCIQIHGGSGYMKEYNAEKLLRDSLVLPIYEGTTQIQALMATKDSLINIIKNPKTFLSELTSSKWKSMFATDPLEKGCARLRNRALSAQRFLMTKIAKQKLSQTMKEQPRSQWKKTFLEDWDPKTDFSPALLHACRLSQMLTDIKICDILKKQADKHPERRAVLARYLERAEPRSRNLFYEIKNTGQRLLTELQQAA